MFKKLKSNLNIVLKSKRKGFNGITHILISIILFFVMFIIPSYIFPPFNSYIKIITENYIFLIVSFLIIVGASLFPDLDSDRSTAVFRLGSTGVLINLFMKSIGNFIWILYHFDKDIRPSIRHRIIFHTPIFAFFITYIAYKFIPNNDTIFLQTFLNIKVKDLVPFILQNIIVLVYVLFAFLNERLFISTILYYPFKKIFKRQNISDLVCFLLSLVPLYFIINLSYNKIKYIGISIGIGYLTHLIGDLFTKGSIPLFYPLPIKGQAYWRPNFFLQISTEERPVKILNNILISIIICNCIYFITKYVGLI